MAIEWIIEAIISKHIAGQETILGTRVSGNGCFMKLENKHNEKKVVLSIIIPHYNSARTLERLLQTIGNYSDVQTIIVDDNSNQDVDYLHKVIIRFKDVTEFYTNGTGIQSAGTCRNIGLELAKGTWILFADSDDYFIDNWYEIVSAYFDSKYDAIYFTPTSVFDDSHAIGIRHLGEQKLIDDYLAFPSQENYMHFARIHSIWSKMYKRSIIESNACRFSETMHANDILMSKKMFYYCENKYFTKEVIYCVTRSKGSLTMLKSEQSLDNQIDEFIKGYHFLEERMTREDFEHIRMSGGKCLYDAYKKGIKLRKIFLGAIKMKKNHVRIIAREYLSPNEFYKSYKRVKAVYKDEEKYMTIG